ncbi:multidrug RND transporter [Corynebacterium yudongzhengii]|uniref:MMPL family transporter n=1 Tax=Corynebacterium yudongzhengii TaxID=2080740 RepID=A0A2U1T5L7_9CORY|nr:MMPL family transporter [Corynebacterium yudongzhengii]AWB81046.1 multidrug RND transporter [Corynebacterium yudongzhengii]PWC01291.1 MMPL family transporter [Corynebacterium yudongzhengii]
MAEFLFRLGKWSFLNKWKVIAAWLVIFAGMTVAALTLMKPFTSEFEISGTPAIEAVEKLDEEFPGAGQSVNAATVNVVFQAPEGETLDEPQNSAAMDETLAYIEDNLDDRQGTERFGNPLKVSEELQRTVFDLETEMGLPEPTARADAENLAMVSDDRTIAYTTFTFDAESAQAVTEDQRQVVRDAIEVGEDAGVRVEAGGPGFGEAIVINTTSEIIGLAVAFIVLIITFGSLISAIKPVVTAVVGVGIGVLTILTSTHWLTLNDITPVLAVMIGLAVGIDYSLFILSRYRAEYQRLGGPDAAGLAAGTAGSSVVFAGMTVFVALAALVIANIEFLTWMGLSAALTVAIAVVIGLTLTPALLGLTRSKAFGGKIPGLAGNPGWGKKEEPPRSSWRSLEGETLGTKWVKLIQRVPGLVIAVVVLGLGAMSLPVSQLEMALPSDATSGKETTQRQSAELMAEGFGEGVNAPFLMIVDADNVNPDAAPLVPIKNAIQDAGEDVNEREAAGLASYLYTVSQANSLVDVKHAQLVTVNDDNSSAQVLVTPETGPADQRTAETASALRSIGTEIQDATGVSIGLTGLTAVQMDITERLGEAMPLYLSVVVGLAIILLLLVFRSIMVPVVASLGFLLSVGASFGLTILVWQEGLWGLVDTPAPLISFMPIFLIGVTFGLAMDYQIFLGTRMREHYVKTGGSNELYNKYNGVEESVVVGFSRGVRVVTAAAVIMIAVFVAFINQPLPFIQIFGFALGLSVFFDAFFIRMGLVPAAMFILGRATWWMPKWMDKILPNIDIEGTKLEERFEGVDRTKDNKESLDA